MLVVMMIRLITTTQNPNISTTKSTINTAIADIAIIVKTTENDKNSCINNRVKKNLPAIKDKNLQTTRQPRTHIALHYRDYRTFSQDYRASVITTRAITDPISIVTK